MPYTPVRDIELIDTGSLGKEVLSNDAFTNLAHGISGTATIALSNVDRTLSATEGQAFILILTGSVTADVNVIVPQESRVYVVDNRCTVPGAHSITVRPPVGGGITVETGYQRALLYCDGSNVFPVASGVAAGGGSGAPTDASYLVGASSSLLSAERLVTDTATITWDLATAGQAKAIIPPDGVSYSHIQNVTSSRLLGRFTAGVGDVQEIIPGTGLALDTGTGVLSATAVGQPLDATLTALAGLATGANQLPYSTGTDTFAQTPLTAFVRTVLDDADAATARSTLGAQASDATLTALAGVTTGADTLPFFTGVDTASTTALTAFMRGLLDDPDLATAQATLGITGGGGYTDEQAQDAVGTILTDSARIDFTYTDATPAITADIVAGSITETQIGLSDVTADNATTVQHGFLPKLSGTATTYLDGTGAWTTPAGGGYTNEQAQDAVGNIMASTATIDLNYSDTLNTITAVLVNNSVTGSHIPNDTITYPKIQNVTDSRLLGRSAGSAGDVQELTVGTGLSLSAGTLTGTGQPLDATLTTIAALTGTANQMLYFTGTDTAALTALTAAGRTLAGAADAAAQRTALALGTMAQQDASAVAITGGTVGGLTSLHVQGESFLNRTVLGGGSNPGAELRIDYDKTVYQGIQMQPLGSDTGPGSAIYFGNVAGSAVGSINTNATTTTYATTSDTRLKHAITALTGALGVVQALRPISHLWRSDDSRGVGFLAHEVQQVLPDAGIITGLPDAVDEEGRIVPQMIDMSKLVPWLTAGLQDALALIDTLSARVASLETQLGV